MACGGWDTSSEHQTSQNNINLENITPNSPQLPLFLRQQKGAFLAEGKCNVLRKTNKPSLTMMMMMITSSSVMRLAGPG